VLLNKEIRTINQIKTALREDARKILRDLDGSTEQRAATREAATRLERFQPPRRCWACGSWEHDADIKEVSRAHIFPIEEGGTTTPENLIPLCVRRHGALRTNDIEKIANKLGCHDLVDQGMLSRSRLVALQSSPVPDPNIRKKLIETARRAPKSTLDNIRKDKGNVRKEKIAALDLYRKARGADGNSVQRVTIFIEAASAIRRAWDEKAIKRAEKILKEVEPYCNQGLPPLLYSRYLYEKAYVELLKDKPQAADTFDLSAQFAQKDKSVSAQVSAVISRAQGLIVRTVQASPKQLRNTLGEKFDVQWVELFTIIIKLRARVTPKDAKTRNHINRWVQILLIGRARLNIKRRRFPLAERLLREWELVRRGLDASTGWTIAMVPVANISFGLIAVLGPRSNPRRKEMLRRLFLGTRLMIWDPRKTIEGLRDAILAVSKALEEHQEPERQCAAKNFREVGERIVDPLSLFPQTYLRRRKSRLRKPTPT